MHTNAQRTPSRLLFLSAFRFVVFNKCILIEINTIIIVCFLLRLHKILFAIRSPHVQQRPESNGIACGCGVYVRCTCALACVCVCATRCDAWYKWDAVAFFLRIGFKWRNLPSLSRNDLPNTCTFHYISLLADVRHNDNNKRI